MAATNFTPISLYYSATASAVPLAANLVAGELALNTNDGKLYYKNSSNVVTLLAGATSGPAGGSNTQVQFNSSGVLAGSANMTFNGTILTAAGFSGPLNGTVGATTPAAGSFTSLAYSTTLTGGTGIVNLGSGQFYKDASGNVGIGTSSPTTKLQVAAAANTGVLVSSTDGTTFKGIAFNTNDNQFTVGTQTNHPLAFFTNNAERMRITSTGGVSFGATGTAYGTTGQVLTSAGNAPPTWTTATSANTVSAIVQRDGSGNFTAGTITANLTGNAATVTNGLYTTGNQTITARNVQQGSQTATMLTATGSLGGLEMQSANASGAAFMTFHRPGAYASYFGIDTDNQFAVGGWSAGAALTNMKVGSFGVGTAASGTAGEIRATNNITAYYSDERLKTKVGDIEDPLSKVHAIKTMLYHANEIAVSLGYDASVVEVGVTAQSVQSVQPQAVAPAPIDEQYLTVRYERLVPLLIEAIKELDAKIDGLVEKCR